MSDIECVFCGIIAGREPASIVYSDDETVAFCDTAPFNPGHVLVVPRGHASFLENLSTDAGAAMFRVSHQLARALRRSGLRCEGVNLMLADGAAAFQEVFHVHTHVIPRWRGDGFTVKAHRHAPRRGELDRTAAAVERGMRALPAAGPEA